MNMLREKEETLLMGGLTLASLLCMSIIARRLLVTVSKPYASPCLYRFFLAIVTYLFPYKNSWTFGRPD